MDQSERSYQLLGGYGAGQRLYHLEGDPNEIVYIVFSPERSQGTGETPRRVKLPILNATEEYLMASGYNWLSKATILYFFLGVGFLFTPYTSVLYHSLLGFLSFHV